MLYNYTPLLQQKILYSCAIWDTCNAGDGDLIPGLGRSPGVGNGNPLQFSWLGNSMDRGAWRATVHGVAESDTIEWAQACIHIITLWRLDFLTLEVKMLSHSVVSNSLWYLEYHTGEYWNGLPFPSPGNLPDAGIELTSPALQADS